jgi:hypothetical protein
MKDIECGRVSRSCPFGRQSLCSKAHHLHRPPPSHWHLRRSVQRNPCHRSLRKVFGAALSLGGTFGQLLGHFAGMLPSQHMIHELLGRSFGPFSGGFRLSYTPHS